MKESMKVCEVLYDSHDRSGHWGKAGTLENRHMQVRLQKAKATLFASYSRSTHRLLTVMTSS